MTSIDSVSYTHLDLVYKHPQDIYERFGLTLEDTPADMYDKRSNNDQSGFPGDPVYWESIIAITHFNDNKLATIELIPISLGHEKPRSVSYTHLDVYKRQVLN